MEINIHELNNAVLRFQQGDQSAIDDVCKVILPIISRYSEVIWFKVKNESEFECRCILKIKRAAKSFDVTKGNFISLARNILNKEKSDFLKRRKSQPMQSIESLAGFDIKDEMVSVEKDFEVKEKVTHLAAGDRRKLAILNHWSDGVFCDSKLSRLLAQSFGGKVESHRKFIQRFRTECQTTAATTV
jgi:hypothetical protein